MKVLFDEPPPEIVKALFDAPPPPEIVKVLFEVPPPAVMNVPLGAVPADGMTVEMLVPDTGILEAPPVPNDELFA